MSDNLRQQLTERNEAQLQTVPGKEMNGWINNNSMTNAHN
jgi:hypothetical protein